MDAAMRIWPHLLILGTVACAALIGVGVFAGLVPTRNAEKSEAAPAKAPRRDSHRAGGPFCANCGTVGAILTVVVAVGPESTKRTVYRITVRMDDGSYRTLSQAPPPSVVVGEAVRIVDGAIIRPPSEKAKG